MTEHNRPVSEQELHAYVDGQLPASRLDQVEAYLAAHPTDAKRIQDFQKLNVLLQDRHARALEVPVPPGLVRPGRQTNRMAFIYRVAASIALLMIGGVMGWSLHEDEWQQPSVSVAFAQQAAYAHALYTPEVLHPVEVGAEREQHLVKWLSKRLGKTVRAPDLSVQGYGLVGGRMLPNDDKPVAQFMYENQRGERLTLYIRANTVNDQDTAFEYLQQDGISVFYWKEGALSYALTGEVEKATLIDVATTVYRALEL